MQNHSAQPTGSLTYKLTALQELVIRYIGRACSDGLWLTGSQGNGACLRCSSAPASLLYVAVDAQLRADGDDGDFDAVAAVLAGIGLIEDTPDCPAATKLADTDGAVQFEGMTIHLCGGRLSSAGWCNGRLRSTKDPRTPCPQVNPCKPYAGAKRSCAILYDPMRLQALHAAGIPADERDVMVSYSCTLNGRSDHADRGYRLTSDGWRVFQVVSNTEQVRHVDRGQVSTNGPSSLNETQKAAADFITAKPGRTQQVVANQIGVCAEHFRSRIWPKLRDHGFYRISRGQARGLYPPQSHKPT